MGLKIVFIFWIVGFLAGCGNGSLVFLGGENKNLNDFKGKWLLINYWAAWCKPCLHEIPELNRFNTRSDVVVLAFNYDQLDEKNLTIQIEKFDIQYQSLISDPAILFSQTKPAGLPATMMINSDGVFVRWLYGAQNKETLLKAISY